ncbi:MAG: phytoene/squalene synthase family protein [Cyanobacteria bacterium SID2]|nr:phytoene/squalene synthase family protein [Cyanobacteria bacterium SID2]MBP0003135.1 phytoene/squalene synthase family protein [Cyanobacteria bacterium SBC]
MNWQKDALEVLKETSRTFYIPISLLPSALKEAVASAYLCMRAIDEIEDHSELENSTKAQLLRSISLSLQTGTGDPTSDRFGADWGDVRSKLPEVTLRVDEWAKLAPDSIAPRIWDATAAMADRMAMWAERNWTIRTVTDLDSYTFSVAGAVGLLLSDLWAWHDNTQTNRMEAIGFGRGLQTVNILRNAREDRSRGVDFFPDGWTTSDMQAYARRNLELADRYTRALPSGPALDFCKIPLVLANGTLKTMALGNEKLTRHDVMELIGQVTRR